ncbi:MAG: GNAT family N-acetyltransferase [Candidatus Zixiibacteriota bacterium]|nr:MAG: GNAT family N-acetyltransferase [candidate division Zixibacteria bacterium]
MNQPVRRKTDLVPYTAEYSRVVRSWIDSEETYYHLCRGPSFPPPEDIVDSWQRNNVMSYLLYAGSKPIGYGELWARPAEQAVEIAHLLIDPYERGKGYGTRLVERLYDRAGERPGVARVLINLFSDSREALGCYVNAGFQIIGTTKHIPGLRMMRLARK